MKKNRKFKFEDTKLLLSRISKLGRVKTVNVVEKKDHYQLFLVLGDLELCVVIKSYPDIPFYAVYISPGRQWSFSAVSAEVQETDDIIRLIKNLHKDKITGDVLRDYRNRKSGYVLNGLMGLCVGGQDSKEKRYHQISKKTNKNN